MPGSIVHHHTAMPTAFWGFVDPQVLAQAELGTFLSHCKGIPHYRIEVASHHHHGAPDFNPIYDIVEDPQQNSPLRSPELEERLAAKMIELLERYAAPECQFTRTGLRA